MHSRKLDFVTVQTKEIERRAFLGRTAQLALTTGSFVSLSGLEPFVADALAATNPKPLTKEQWLTEWLKVAPRDVDGPLILFRFKDPMWVLNKQISWFPNPSQADGYPRVDVPRGFVTDLASIPRLFWSLLRPDGEYAYPAIVHDYLYWTQTTTRDAANQIFKLGMQDFGIDSATIDAIYAGVVLGGASSWSGNAKLKSLGEKRILIKTPEDPRVTWVQWKRQPGVFAP